MRREARAIVPDVLQCMTVHTKKNKLSGVSTKPYVKITRP